MADQGPLPPFIAWASVARCVVTTAGLLATRRVHLPHANVGRLLRFANGSAAYVYRETVVTGPRSPIRPFLWLAFASAEFAGEAMTCFGVRAC